MAKSEWAKGGMFDIQGCTDGITIDIKTQWISVKDALPDLVHEDERLCRWWSETVAVLYSQSQMPFTDYMMQHGEEKPKWCVDCMDDEYPGHVTHWFPLPKLPKEK